MTSTSIGRSVGLSIGAGLITAALLLLGAAGGAQAQSQPTVDEISAAFTCDGTNITYLGETVSASVGGSLVPVSCEQANSQSTNSCVLEDGLNVMRSTSSFGTFTLHAGSDPIQCSVAGSTATPIPSSSPSPTPANTAGKLEDTGSGTILATTAAVMISVIAVSMWRRGELNLHKIVLKD